MSAKTILTTLQTTLAGVQASYPWEKLPVSADGVIQVPAASYFVHSIVSGNDMDSDFGEPVFTIDIQVDSWAATQGAAFDNLALADTALIAVGWRLTSIDRLQIEPGQDNFGVAGTFQLDGAFSVAA